MRTLFLLAIVLSSSIGLAQTARQFQELDIPLSPLPATDLYSREILVEDLNGDGFRDVVYDTSVGMRIFMNDGYGNLADITPPYTSDFRILSGPNVVGHRTFPVAIGRFRGPSALPDILFAGQPRVNGQLLSFGLYLFENTSTPGGPLQMTEGSMIISFTPPLYDADLGDVNGDGLLDIVTLIGNSGGGLARSISVYLQQPPVAGTTLTFSSSQVPISIFAPRIGSPNSVYSILLATRITVGDFASLDSSTGALQGPDGFADLIVGVDDPFPLAPGNRIFCSDIVPTPTGPARHFVTNSAEMPGARTCSTSHMLLCDIDNDGGVNDLVVVNNTWNTTPPTPPINGAGSFFYRHSAQGVLTLPLATYMTNLPFTMDPSIDLSNNQLNPMVRPRASAADVDMDGDQDIVVVGAQVDPANPNGLVPLAGLLRNGLIGGAGVGNFTSEVITPSMDLSCPMALADMDSDGDPDLVIGTKFAVKIVSNQHRQLTCIHDNIRTLLVPYTGLAPDNFSVRLLAQPQLANPAEFYALYIDVAHRTTPLPLTSTLYLGLTFDPMNPAPNLLGVGVITSGGGVDLAIATPPGLVQVGGELAFQAFYLGQGSLTNTLAVTFY